MPEVPFDARRFKTKREVAISQLEGAIRSGRYAPGQELRQIQLVEDLGLGATPVREAVLELLARGILVQESHRSVRVADLDLDRLRNIYRVRALLETEAARLGTARISDEDIRRMKKQLELMSKLISDGDIPGADAAGHDFRYILYASSGNAVLVTVIDQTWSLFPGTILWNIPGRPKQSLKEHRVVFDAVARRDPTAAAFSIDAHLQSAFHAFEAHLATFSRRASAALKSQS